jgi:hypothetical protein
MQNLDRMRSKSFLLFSEINQLSAEKFSIDSFLFAFGEEDLLHQSWRTDFTTRALNIKESLIQDDAVIYAPYIVNLEDVGYAWMLKVFEEIVQHWKSHNHRIREMRSLGRSSTLQQDLFQPMDSRVKNDGIISDIINFTLSNCFRVRVNGADQAETAMFLICVRILSLSKDLKIPLRPLDSIEEIFVI